MKQFSPEKTLVKQFSGWGLKIRGASAILSELAFSETQRAALHFVPFTT
jgi:hypothetical protein